MLEGKADPRRHVFQRGDHFQRACLEIFLQVAAAGRGRLAGRVGALKGLFEKSRRPGGVLGASRGVWGSSSKRLGAVLTCVGSEEPNPRQGSQIGGREESKRESALGGGGATPRQGSLI